MEPPREHFRAPRGQAGRTRAWPALPALLIVLLLCLCSTPARAAGLAIKPGSFLAAVSAAGGGEATQAASNPGALQAGFEVTGGEELARIQLDLPPGLALDPQAAGAQCEVSAFEALPERECPAESQVGSDEMTLAGGRSVNAPVYALVAPAGLPGAFGVYIPAGGGVAHPQHLLVKVRISPADFHESLQLELPAGLGLTASTLKLEDRRGAGLFTLPSVCSAAMSWTLTVGSAGGASEADSYHSSGVQGCQTVPFTPSLAVKQSTTVYGQPATVTVTASLPGQGPQSDIAREAVSLPSGLVLNLPGLAALQACSPAQASLGQEVAAACPAGAQIGTASLLTRILPEALSGGIYLAAEGLAGGSSSSQAQFPVYLELGSARYGVAMHLKGTLAASRTEGTLELLLAEAPQLPVSELQLSLGGGAAPVLVNATACAGATLQATLTPYTTLLSAPTLGSQLSTTGCPAHPASAAQSTSDLTHRAAAPTSFSVAFSRGEPGLSFSHFRTVLPDGLVAHFPAAGRCPEAQATQGQCPADSEIGVGSIEMGAGGVPLTLTGHAYLTSAYEGAPFGLLLQIPAAVGPFQLGELLVRAKLGVVSGSGQIELEGTMPRIVDGVPLRPRRISLSLDRPGLLYNPTACGAVRTQSTLGSSTASSSVSITGCQSLAFDPAVSAASSASSSPSKGANLEASISVPRGDADVRSLLLQLPRQFLLRTESVAGACSEATVKSDPSACPAGSFVGSAGLSSPMLATRLAGPAILAVAAQTKLPELFLVLEAEGVRLVLTGSFRSVNGITFLAFGSEPDLPIGQLALNLQGGAHSALTLEPRAGICPLPLTIPTYITAWNKKEAKLRVPVRPVGCGVRIVGHKVVGDVAYLTVQTFTAGRISGSGPGLRTTYRRLSRAAAAAGLRVSLSRHGRRRRRPFKVRLRVGFLPADKAAPSSAYVTVSFR